MSHEYDALNRPNAHWIGQVTNGEQIAQHAFDDVGNLAATGTNNGLTHTYSYDDRNALSSVKVADLQLEQTLLSYTYLRDDHGNRVSVSEQNGREVNYTYDELHRLTSERVTDAPIAGLLQYSLDKVGNRLSRVSLGNLSSTLPSESSTFSANDHLIGDTTDANGNTLQSQVPAQSGGSILLPNPPLNITATDTYDFENRLIRRTRSDGMTIDITYDAEGVRVGKDIYQGALLLSQTRWLVDKNNLTGYSQVVEVLDGLDNLLATHHFGLSLLAVTDYTRPIQQQRIYPQFDGHGSVRALSDEAGVLTDTIDYDAWGNVIARTGTTPFAYGYCSEEWDSDLGMVYLRARYMNPANGRFHTMDTYEGRNFEPLSLHKYLYANANPVMGKDPSGQITLIELSLSILSVQTSRNIDNSRAQAQRKAVYATLCRAAAKLADKYIKIVRKISRSKLTRANGLWFEAHHVFQNAQMASAFHTYSRLQAFSIPLLGGSGLPGSPHDLATQYQNTFGGLGFRVVSFGALRAAGCRNSDATSIVLAAEEHNRLFGGKRGTPLR